MSSPAGTRRSASPCSRPPLPELHPATRSHRPQRQHLHRSTGTIISRPTPATTTREFGIDARSGIPSTLREAGDQAAQPLQVARHLLPSRGRRRRLFPPLRSAHSARSGQVSRAPSRADERELGRRLYPRRHQLAGAWSSRPGAAPDREEDRHGPGGPASGERSADARERKDFDGVLAAPFVGAPPQSRVSAAESLVRQTSTTSRSKSVPWLLDQGDSAEPTRHRSIT